MSVDYYVVVPAEQWPTAAQVQTALEKDGFPVRLAAVHMAAPMKPFSEVPADFGLDVVSQGKPMRIWVSINKLNSKEARRGAASEVTDASRRLKFRAKPQDYVVHFEMSALVPEWKPAYYIVATLLVHFDGVGYDAIGDFKQTKSDAPDLVEFANEYDESIDEMRKEAEKLAGTPDPRRSDVEEEKIHTSNAPNP